MLPSGRAKTFANRVGWATTYLYQTKLLERPKRSVYRITHRGHESLAQNPTRVDLRVLAQFEELQEFRAKAPPTGSKPTTEIGREPDEPEHTPEEQIDAAYRLLRSALASEVLERVRAIACLLRAVGLGRIASDGLRRHPEDAASRLGQSGDEGVDGVIREDELGLDLIYVQAKRWQNPAGRPKIQKFFGALHGKRANKGVFITTSSFSNEAASFAESVTPRVILVDGKELARLMIEYGVGVASSRTYEIKRIDLDYFASDEEEASGPPLPAAVPSQ